MRLGVNETGRAALDGNLAAGLVHVGDGMDVGVRPDEQTNPGVHVGIRKVDGFAAFVGGGHRRDDEVDLARFERRDQAGEFRVLDVRLFVQVGGERLAEFDADAGRLVVFVGHLEGWIRQFHADDQLAARRFGPGAGSQQPGSRKRGCHGGGKGPARQHGGYFEGHHGREHSTGGRRRGREGFGT